MISEKLAAQLAAISEYLSGLIEPFPALRVLEKNPPIFNESEADDYLRLISAERDYYKFKWQAIKEVFNK